jgi:hypothetical protein
VLRSDLMGLVEVSDDEEDETEDKSQSIRLEEDISQLIITCRRGSALHCVMDSGR